MEDLSLHILDIAENAVRAGARLIEIDVRADDAARSLTVEVRDDGCGMDEATRQRALSPFGTSRTERDVGLGLPLLAQSARETGGECTVHSAPGRGTRVVATFNQAHIDCKPLGDLASSVRTLAVGNPQVDVILELSCGDQSRRLDTRDLRAVSEKPVSGNASDNARRPFKNTQQQSDPRFAEHHDGGNC